MKKTLALLTALLVIAMLSACQAPKDTSPTQSPNQDKTEQQVPDQQPEQQQTPKEQQIITKERAIELALKEAGVDKTSAFDIEAELDYERGVEVWEVDFETRDHEYSYDIDAYNGTVTKADREVND